MITLEAGPTLSGVSPLDRVRFVRDELADDLVISAVISMAAIEIWRHIMITTQWLENLVKRNISNYEERVRTEGRTEGHAEGHDQGRAEGRDQGHAEGRDQGRAEGRDQGRAEVRDQARDQARDQILSLLDEDTRKDIERKLHHNHHPENGD